MTTTLDTVFVVTLCVCMLTLSVAVLLLVIKTWKDHP
jgi:hypothetical protein